jgi:hypothetical protein
MVKLEGATINFFPRHFQTTPFTARILPLCPRSAKIAESG